MTPTDQTPQQPLGTGEPAPDHADMSGTDLLLAQLGSSGITPELIDALLDRALDAVPAPPLHDTSRSAIYQWLRDVQDGMSSRREQRWLARQVAQVMFDEWSTADWIERTREMVVHRAEDERQRRAGTYWSIREARRSSRRPARLRVDDDSWQILRRQADTEGTTLGELLGELLHREATRIVGGGQPLTVTDDRPKVQERFIRIAIDDAAWEELKHAARAAGASITSYNSEVITKAANTAASRRRRC